MNSKFFPSGMGLLGRFLNEMLIGGGKNLSCSVLMLCLCLLGQTALWSQTYECGAISQGSLSGEPKYVDRFGNLYGQADVTADPNAQSHCHNTGDFELLFVETTVGGTTYSFTQAEMSTICEVFQYLSGLLTVPPTRRARIELTKNPLLAANTFAAASPYFPNQCGLGHSLIHRVFATNAVYPPGTLHGHIEINPAVDFYNGPENPPVGTPGDLVDLYSVVLHEALHLLGFASTVNLSGGPADGFYTLWDLNLRNEAGEHMIANEPSSNTCCLDYHLNTPAFPDFPERIWGQDCGDLVFDVPQAPPVNANYPGQSQLDFMNTLSHLDDDCGDDYVMNFEINLLSNDGIRRVLTPAEVAILCRLGYTVGGNCDAACFVMAGRDGPFVRENRLSADGFPWVLEYDRFLQNDVVSADAIVRFPQGCLDNNLFSFVNDTVARTVTINFVGNIAIGYYRLCYSLTGCDERSCDRGIIQMVVDARNSTSPTGLAFCDPSDCRMVCNGDFEEYFPTESDFHFQVGMTRWEDIRSYPYIRNTTLDICYMPTTSNQVVGGTSSQTSEEAFVYPLKRPIPPNCTATISFDCAVYVDSSHSIVRVPWRVLGLSALPSCPTIEVPVGCDTALYTNYQCGSLSSVCIGEVPVGQLGSSPVISTYELVFGDSFYPFNTNRGSVRAIDSFSLRPVTLTWTNDSNIPINCIMIDYRLPASPTVYTYNYIDNFAVELAPGCLNYVTITPTVQSACIEGVTAIDFEICLNGTVPGPADVALTVPINSLFGITYAGGGDFVNGGTTVTGMVPGQCVTRRLMLNLPGSIFDGQALDFDIVANIVGACWNNQGDNTFQVVASDCCELALDADFSFQLDCNMARFQSAPNAAHVTHAWDFDGNGTIDSNQPNPVYIYPSNGQYKVSHTIANNCGNVSTVRKDVTISCNMVCPCTAANTLNIDATTEHRYSVLEAQHNYDKNNDGILDASDHSGCIAITGRLDVDVDLKITGAQTVRMYSQASVQPNPGVPVCAEIAVVQNTTTGAYAFLTLDGNNFYGCDRMWRGITVNAHCGLRASGNSFYDAEFAIRAIASSSGLFTLAPSTQAYITNNMFYRNHVGVMFDGTNAGGFASVYHAPFSGNVFNGAGPLLPTCSGNLANYSSSKGYAGFVTLGVSAAAEFDIFLNLRNGIIGENTWMDATHCEFFEVLGGVSHSGTFPDPFAAGFSLAAGIGILHKSGLGSITACDFHNVDLGVFGKDNLMAVTDNNMQDVIDGVLSVGSLGLAVSDNPAISFREIGVEIAYPILSSVGETKVINNTFTTLPQASIGVSAYHGNNTQAQEKARIASNYFNVHYPASSIILNGSSNWLLDGNYTSASSLPEGANFESYRLEDSHSCQEYGNGAELFSGVGQIGAAFYTAMSANNLFCCNYSNGFETGMVFDGPCENTVLRKQMMMDHEVSIRCEQATVLGKQPDIQANPLDNHSNEFNENPIEGINAGVAQHLGETDQVRNSRFYVKTNQSPDYPIAIITPNSTEPWFEVRGNPNTSCQGSCPPPNPWGNTPQTAIAYATGAYMEDDFGEVLTWEGQLRLYEHLVQNPSLVSTNDTLSAFYAAAQNGALAAFVAAEVLAGGINELPETVGTALGDAIATITAARDDIDAQRTALALSATEADSTARWSAIDSIRKAVLPAMHEYFAKRTMFDSLRHQRAAAALPFVLALPDTNLWQNNRKTVLRLYLQIVGMGVDSLDAQQFAEVSAIAHQCPKVGGSAVYRARALYQMRERKQFGNDTACVVISERTWKTGPAPLLDGIALSPNPADQTVLLGLPSRGVAQLEVFDAHGKRVYVGSIGLEQRTALLDVGTWPDGVYYCRLVGGRHTTTPARLVVHH